MTYLEELVNEDIAVFKKTNFGEKVDLFSEEEIVKLFWESKGITDEYIENPSDIGC